MPDLQTMRPTVNMWPAKALSVAKNIVKPDIGQLIVL